MPQVQVIDTTEAPAEPTGVEQFFSRLGKSFKDKSDRMEIGKLLDDYRDNREQANAWENLQLDLEKSDISPTRRLETQQSLNEMQKTIIAKDKALNSQVKSAEKQKDEKAPVRQALNTLGRQKEILASGHLGPKVGIIGTGRKAGSTFSSEGQKLRAEYKRLGKSLIQQSTNIPIRNRQEFETLAEDLYDPDLSQEEIGGIIDAMDRILKNSLDEQEIPPSTQQSSSFKEGQTATGPNGQKIVFKGGKWQPV